MSSQMGVNRMIAVGAAALGAAVVAAFWIVQGPLAAAISAAWVAGFLALFHFGRPRSDAIRTMSGAGDERTRHLHTNALAFGGFVIWAVTTTWWIVSSIAGDENAPVGILAMVFGVAYIGAALYQARRG
jgi:hypothetical protein